MKATIQQLIDKLQSLPEEAKQYELDFADFFHCTIEEIHVHISPKRSYIIECGCDHPDGEGSL